MRAPCRRLTRFGRAHLAALLVATCGSMLDAQAIDPEGDASNASVLEAVASQRLALYRQILGAEPPLAIRTAVDELGSRRSPESLLLIYDWQESGVRLAAIPSGSAAAEIGPKPVVLQIPTQELADKIESVGQSLRRRSRSARGALARALDELGDDLLGPVADPLRGATNLVVIATGPLLDLPFAALRVPRATDRRRPPLVATHSVCSELWPLGDHGDRTPPGSSGDPATWRAAAFADPEFRASTRPLGAALADRGVSWRPRGESTREAELVSQLFPETLLFVGAAATRRALDDLPADVRILHLAAASGEAVDPGGVSLSLATGDPLAPAELFPAQELAASFRLDAELVVLSRHRSGSVGEPGRYGGLPLALAFARSGARQILISLWPVPLDSTLVLFEHFYRGLLEGLPAGESLRRAQQRLSRAPVDTGAREPFDARSPHYWAGYQLLGDCRS